MTGLPLSDFGLWLVCGLPPAPGDTNTAETGPYGNGMYTLDFSGTNGQEGFGLSDADWIAQIVQPKPVMSGNEILRYEYPNVLETINLVVTGGTAAVTNALLSKLARYTQLIADFWTGAGIEPVYLKWKAVGSPGYQYAIIRNLNYADRTSGVLGMTAGNLVVTVEREPFWRALPPGANPKEWALEAAGLTRGGTGYTYSDMALMTGTDSLVNVTVSNATELSATTTIATKNYADIPASSIPGDAPPLVTIGFTNTGGGGTGCYVSAYTQNVTIKDRLGVTYPQVLDLAAGDAKLALGVDASITTDTGGLKSITYGATRKRMEVSFATYTSLVSRASWGLPSGVFPLFANLTLGKYAVFARARQTGAADTIYMQLNYQNSGVGFMDSDIVSVPAVAGTGNTTSWPLIYMGTLSIPVDGRQADTNRDGRGLAADSSTEYDLSIGVLAERRSGTGVLYISDILLVPISAGSANIPASALIDQSGYFSRGKSGMRMAWNSSSMAYSLTEFDLKPRVNNRIYFLMYNISTLYSTVTDGANVYINIVPRWVGRRDV